MRIIQITACPNPANAQVNLFGLGEDNLVYQWSYKLGGWSLNTLEADQKRFNVAAQQAPFVGAEEGAKARKARRAAAAKKRRR